MSGTTRRVRPVIGIIAAAVLVCAPFVASRLIDLDPTPAASTGEPVFALPVDPPTPQGVPQRSPAVKMPAHVDGCDHAYGEPHQCVPWNFPPDVTDKCAYLLERGFGRLAVHGGDRHGLDPDHNGVACG